MAARYKRRTKNFFIKRDLQGKMVLAIFLSVIVGCLLFALLLGIFSADTMTISYTDNGVQVGRTPWMLLKSAVTANWIFLVIGGTFLVLASMIGTHRIAGPLFRFEKVLNIMAEGNLSDTIQLREKDEGKELAAKINDFNSTLSKQLRGIDRHTEAINDLLAQYDSLKVADADPDDAESIYRAIKRHNDKIRTRISFFTLSNE